MTASPPPLQLKYDGERRVRLVYALNDISVALSAADFLWHIEPDEPCSNVEIQRYRCYEHAAVIE
jgi:hypothetical protein